MKHPFRTHLTLNRACAAFAMLASCKVQLPDYVNEMDAGKGPNGSSVSAKTDSSQNASTTSLSSARQPGSSDKPANTAASTSGSKDETDASVTGPEIGPDSSETDTETDSGTPRPETSAPLMSSAPSTSEAPMTSSAPAASSAVPVSKDVHGRIIDPNHRALPNLVVKVGETTVVTNQNGEFTIPNAPDTYDVQFQINNEGQTYAPRGWRYVGLTRRDPTLQSLNSDLPFRGVNIKITSPLSANSTENVAVAFGSAEETWNLSLRAAISPTQYWRGPSALNVKGHALQIQLTNNLPTRYAAYEESTQSFADAETMTWDLKLPGATPTAVDAGNITGTVTVSQEESRTNHAYLVFNSNAAIPLFYEYPTNANFTYLTPSIPSSSVLLLARNRNFSNGADAYAYRRGLASGQSGVGITIPSPVVLTAPASAAVVNETSVFSWSGTDAVALFSIWDGEDGVDRRNFIVTSQKNVQALKLAALPLTKNHRHVWHVQVHGSCASVDECSGPDGAFDPMYFFDTSNTTTAPVKRDGSWSQSAESGVTTAN